MKQHTAPCGDCPWRRNSAPGWLGGATAVEWVGRAHGEVAVDCHTSRTGAQCAGIAIYRGNVAKTPRHPEVLKLPANHKAVFSTPMQFKEHHEVFAKDRVLVGNDTAEQTQQKAGAR